MKSQADQSLASTRVQVRRPSGARPQRPVFVRELQRHLRLRRRYVEPLRFPVRFCECLAGYLPDILAGLSIRAGPVSLLEPRILRTGLLEGHSAPDARIRSPHVLGSTAV